MKCTPGRHDPHAQIDENMRCSTCGKILPIGSVAFDRDSAIEHLMTILVGNHRAQGIAIQFFAGSWQAGIRTANGVGPTVKGRDPTDALVNLVHTLEEGW